MSAPHTPGLWKAEGDCWVVTVSPRGYVAAVYDGTKVETTGHAVAMANARLIAAAPELLAALRCFLEDDRFRVAVVGNPIVVDRMLDYARAAIAKATGET